MLARRPWALATLATLFVGGCGPSTDTAKVPSKPGSGRIVLITNGNSDWWSAVEKGMRDAGTKFSADVEMKRGDASVERQIRYMEEALGAPDVKGVAVSVVEPDARGIAGAMRKLKAAGKFVITIDSDIAPGVADETRRFYIGTDNAKAGEITGKVTATLRPRGGTVAVFVGTASAANARARLEGFYVGAGDKFVNPPVEKFEDHEDQNKARSLPEISITKYPDVGVMLGLYSYNAPLIASEVAKKPEFRKKTTVVTFDLDEQAVKHIENGNIDVSVCQNPYDIGYQAVRVLKALDANDESTVAEMFPEKATSLETGVRVIVPNADSPIKGPNVITIKDMKEWLVGKGLKSS